MKQIDINMSVTTKSCSRQNHLNFYIDRMQQFQGTLYRDAMHNKQSTRKKRSQKKGIQNFRNKVKAKVNKNKCIK